MSFVKVSNRNMGAPAVMSAARLRLCRGYACKITHPLQLCAARETYVLASFQPHQQLLRKEWKGVLSISTQQSLIELRSGC